MAKGIFPLFVGVDKEDRNYMQDAFVVCLKKSVRRLNEDEKVNNHKHE